MKKSLCFVLIMLLVLMIPVCILAAFRHEEGMSIISCSDYNLEEGDEQSRFSNDIQNECTSYNNRANPQIPTSKPSINGPDTIFLTESYTDAGQTYTLTGHPHPEFTISANQPNTAGATLSGTTLTIPQGLAAAGSPYTVTVEAANSEGAVTKTVTVTVSPAPAPPAIDGPDIFSLTEGYADAGQNYTLTGYPVPDFTISATQPNTAGATLSGTTLTIPAGLTATGSPYTVTLDAANTAGTVTKTVTVTVSLPPAPPAIDGPDTVSLTEGYTDAGQNYTLTGYPVPDFTISTTLPNTAGASLSGTALTIPAGLAATGSPYSVTLDAANTAGTVSKTVTVTVSPAPAPPVIDGPDTVSLTEGYTDAVQNFTLTGYPVPDFTIGATQPNTAGASLSGTTLIVPSGLSAAGSPYTVTLDAANTAGTVSKTVTVTVSPPPAPPAIDGPDAVSLMEGYPDAGQNYTLTGWPVPDLTVSAGYPNTAGASLSGTTLTVPQGLTAAGSPYTVTLDAANTEGVATKTITVAIQPVNIVLSPASLPGAWSGSAYPGTALTADGGWAPYTFAVTTGSLPAGLSLNSSTGALGGTCETDAADYAFTVTAADSQGHTGTKDYTIRAYDAISLENTEFNATYGGASTYVVGLLNASGGAGGPYTFAMAGGSLPNGCTLESNGLINGQATESGDFTMLVRVTDKVGNSADISVTIHAMPLDP